MTNQQAPEIYALHTVPNKGEMPWSGIYAVRADAEHDAKVLRDATGRDWSVVRLVVADTATTPTGPVARYKISYATDDWGMRSSTPSGIPDHAGAWVRYEDHAAELLRLHTENEALRAQQDDAYDHGPQAETVEEAARDVGKWLNERPNRPLDLRHVAMLTHHAKRTPQPSPTAQAASSAVLKAIREANMQLVRTGDNAFMLVPYKVATAQAAESVPAGAERAAFEANWCERNHPVPLNSRLRDDGRYGDHLIQSEWEAWQASAARAPADSVQEDAALWHWLAEYLVGTRTDLDDEIVASETVNDLRKLVEAARKQGANHD